MAVPEAAVDENNASPLSEHDVGAANQVLDVEPVTITETVKKSPYHEFGFGIFSLHGGHCRTSLLRCQSVHWKAPPLNRMLVQDLP
jgi:hypothetical protein